MKRKKIQFITIVLSLIVAICACKKEPLGGIVVDKDLIMVVGKTATLTVTFIPSNASNKKMYWESSDTNIATVEDGKITGIAVGIVKITAIADDGGRRAQCMVSVIQPIEPELIRVEGGTFTMGCAGEQGVDCYANETPTHEVTLSSFYIGKFEVTQKEWIATMVNNPSFDKGDSIPVQDITWNEVQKYIQRLNTVTGKNYRLLTEAEWEYAARGGNQSQGYKYSGSNNIDEVAWYSENASFRAHPVGMKKANELGIFDMTGNLFEWCNDWYSIYTSNAQINPLGPAAGNKKVVRGGSWYTSADGSVFARGYMTETEKCIDTGFRLALAAGKKE